MGCFVQRRDRSGLITARDEKDSQLSASWCESDAGPQCTELRLVRKWWRLLRGPAADREQSASCVSAQRIYTRTWVSCPSFVVRPIRIRGRVGYSERTDRDLLARRARSAPLFSGIASGASRDRLCTEISLTNVPATDTGSLGTLLQGVLVVVGRVHRQFVRRTLRRQRSPTQLDALLTCIADLHTLFEPPDRRTKRLGAHRGRFWVPV